MAKIEMNDAHDGRPYITDEAMLLHEIRDLLTEIRDTLEQLVKIEGARPI